MFLVDAGATNVCMHDDLAIFPPLISATERCLVSVALVLSRDLLYPPCAVLSCSLWPVLASGFSDLVQRGEVQAAAHAENKQRMQQLKDLAHKLRLQMVRARTRQPASYMLAMAVSHGPRL